MFNLIMKLVKLVLSPILSLLNFIEVPEAMVNVTASVMGYIQDGCAILNFFMPFSTVGWAVDIFLSVFTVVHAYKIAMWVIKKIPLLGVK